MPSPLPAAQTATASAAPSLMLAMPALLLWALGLALVCCPLWLLSLIFLQLSNWCLAMAYGLRDALAALGDKLERHQV